jgi:signal transduction histidine kinase/CheY-like chemotaxis protein
MPDKIEILLVDDRPENLVALEALLTSPEYHLVKAASGEDALKHLLESSPALILMDVQMPGLDGFETASLIKSNERTRNIPIIFVTAMDLDQRFVHRGYRYGAVDYVYKPYDGYVLSSKVSAFVELHRQQVRMARLVRVQQAATSALGAGGGIDVATESVMQSTCDLLGWQSALCWRVDPEHEALRCVAQWHKEMPPMGRWLRGPLRRGANLPGQVWDSGRAVWVARERLREAHAAFTLPGAEGMRTAVCVPITATGETIGVLEFFGTERSYVDDPLLEIMGAIGAQLGQATRRDQAVKEAQAAIQVRDTFFSIASHELKTPITSLKMQLQLAARSMKADPAALIPTAKLAKTVGIALHQIEQLIRLVDEMLDVVRIRAGRLELSRAPVDLADLVAGVLDSYGEALASVRCAVSSELEPRVVGEWDRTRVEQALVNLLSNAIKYAPGANVDITVSRVGDVAQLIVSDHGPGIPAAMRDIVFDRFERGHALRTVGGLGLGLYIVKHVVEAHGGSVKLDSEAGRGSTFTLALPLNPPETIDEAPPHGALLEAQASATARHPAAADAHLGEHIGVE